MTWVRLDDGIYDHPKMLAVQPADRLLYVWALCWSARHGTDGTVPATALPYLALFAGADVTDAVDRLVAAGLWHATGSGYTVHDFDDYQPSAAEVAEIRRKRSESGRVGGLRSADARTKPQANGQANAQALATPVASTSLKQTATPSSSRPRPHKSSVSQSSDSLKKDGRRDDDDDDLVEQTIKELGRRDHDRALAEGVTVRNRAGHLAACVDKRRAETAAVAALAAANPTWPPERVADELEDPGGAERRAGRERALKALEIP
jgi:hypothetical protein